MKKGLVIINTGDGKGKTTAALGQVIRACGQGLKVLFLQFIKSGGKYGEIEVAKNISNLTIKSMGKGFVRCKDNGIKDNEHSVAAQKAWEYLRLEVVSKKWDMIVLDEINYAINFGLVKLEDVEKLLDNKPKELHMVLTGRNAKQSLIDRADTVTEMKMIKHAYNSGVKAQAGIEF